jgi:hypothetical protein
MKHCFVFHLVLVSILGACSSGSGLLIASNPEGAEIRSISGETIGKTPLQLTSEQENQITSSGLFQVKITSKGHIPQHLFLDTKNVRDVNVTLTPTSEEVFKTEFANDFSKELNQLLRSAFHIQKLMGAKKISDATEAAEKFKKDYPQLAYGYMIAAHFALLKGERAKARNNILQAQEIDPDDPAIAQSLQLLRRGPN